MCCCYRLGLLRVKSVFIQLRYQVLILPHALCPLGYRAKYMESTSSPAVSYPFKFFCRVHLHPVLHHDVMDYGKLSGLPLVITPLLRLMEVT
jgi:hypothetical protein